MDVYIVSFFDLTKVRRYVLWQFHSINCYWFRLAWWKVEANLWYLHRYKYWLPWPLRYPLFSSTWVNRGKESWILNHHIRLIVILAKPFRAASQTWYYARLAEIVNFAHKYRVNLLLDRIHFLIIRFLALPCPRLPLLHLCLLCPSGQVLLLANNIRYLPLLLI